ISVVPIDDPLVEPNETVIVTITPTASYVAGAPGLALVTIVSDDLPPDLVITAVSAPAVAGPGAVISVSDTTKNQGTGPSPASATGYYLSANTSLDSNDVLLGTRSIPALAVGASDAGSTTVTIPAATATGTYYVIAKADQGDSVPESQESNNTKWSTSIAVGPDLTVSALTVPTTAGAGGTIAVTDTTTNSGGGAAAPTTTSFYLSANVSLDASDTLIGSRSVGALAAGAASTATTSLTIPAGTATGLYYVIAQADSANAVVEAQEANNTKFGVTQVGADLTVTSITVPAAAGAGTTIV